MFSWLTNLFMGSTADAALDAAIYSAGLASTCGLHQMQEPDELQELVRELED